MTEMMDNQILESLLTGVFIADAKTKEIIFLNSAASDMIGNSIDEIMGNHCFDYLCKDGRTQCPLQDLGKTISKKETTIVRKDGSTLHVLKTARFIKIDERDCILESFVDISDQKQLEKALRLSEVESSKKSDFLNKVINSVPYPFYVIDSSDYSLILANSACGVDLSTKKYTCYELTHHANEPCSGLEHLCPLVEVKKTRTPVVTEHVHYDKEGNSQIFEVHGNPIIDQDGAFSYMIEYNIDITRRKKSLAALVESEAMFRAMSEQAPIGIAITDLDGNVIHTAGTWLDIFGMSKAEDSFNVNLFSGSMIPEEKMQELKQGNSIAYESIFDFSSVHKADSYKCSKTGIMFIETTIIPLRFGEESKIEKYQIMVQDVTKNKEEEFALHKRTTFLKATGRMAKVGGWEVDALTNEVSWTEETYRIHEVPFDQKPLLAEAINYFHPEERERLTAAIRLALNQGEPYDMEMRFITAKGKELWTRTICHPVVVDGKTIKLIGTFQDVTDRVVAETAVKESEDCYRTVLQSMQDIIFVHDKEDIYTQVYASDNNILTRPIEQFIGKHVTDVVSSEIAKKHLHYSSLVRSTGLAQQYDYEMKIKGTTFWFTSLLTLHEDGESIVAVVRETTDSKLAEISLKHSEERYRRFIDILPEGVIIGDTKENIMLANRAMGEILGIDSDDLIGRNLMDFIDPRYQSQVGAQTRRRICGSTSEYEIRIIRADGEPRDVHISATPHLNEHYEIEGAIGVISDITARREMEKEVRKMSYELQERLKEIQAISAASDLMKDTDTPLETIMNEIIPIICAGFQFPPITCGRILIDDLQVSSSNFDNPVATIFEEIWISESRSGQIEIGYLEQRPESDQGPFLGEEVSMINQIAVDLSQFVERKRAQQEIIQQSAKLDAVTRSALDAIIMIDNMGLVQFWNPAAERIFGYLEKEMIDRNLHEVIVPSTYFDIQREGFEKFPQTGTGAAFGKVIELSGLKKNGSEFPIELAITAVKLGRSWGAVCIIRDITERKTNEQERLLQQKELEIYTSLLRHDLNNDLAGIVGSLEVVNMLINEDPSEAQQFLDSSIALAVRMGNLLGAVGRTQKFQDEPIEDMIRNIAKLSAQTKIGLEIQVIVDDEFDCTRLSGSRLLPMVFENLFRNAVQHAGEMPEVTVKLSVIENQVIIVVSDNGCGVPEDMRDQLFERGISTKDGGGLGLHLSKKIVEAIGGSISLMTQKKDKGAQFKIELPLIK